MSKLLQVMEEYGADIDGVLDRFIQDEELYQSCLNMFTTDEELNQLEEAMSNHQYDKAFELAHGLKGVIGNLGLTPLYNSICNLVECLRAKEYQKGQQAYEAFEQEWKRFITAFQKAVAK